MYCFNVSLYFTLNRAYDFVFCVAASAVLTFIFHSETFKIWNILIKGPLKMQLVTLDMFNRIYINSIV